MDKKLLVVCAIFKNEARYLLEWLTYHHLVGVDHFVLYDNGSTDDPARVIGSSPMAEHVTLIRWPQRPGQLPAYRHFIDIFAPGFEWAAFIDLDEFLLPLNGRKVQDTLDRLPGAAAVLVQWRVFGPGPWDASPPGLVIENYDQRAADDFPTNGHVKTIARCSELLDVTENPHEFKVNGPVFNTAGHLAPNTAIQAQPCYQHLVLNHYFSKSRQDWLAKIQRGSAMFDYTTPKYEAGLFDHLAEVCRFKDDTIKAFVPEVRRRLRAGAAALPPEPISQRPAVPGMAEPGGMAGMLPGSAVATPLAPDPMTPTPMTPAPITRTPMTRAPMTPAPLAPRSPVALPDEAAIALPATRDAASPAQWAGAAPVGTAPVWVARGQDAQERTSGLGLVFRDRSRPGERWLAALRGPVAAGIDPAFLLDEFDRIRDFPTDAEARAACDAALARAPRH